MTDRSEGPSPTAIKRFLRDTARAIQNDYATAKECFDDFLQIDPYSSPKEAGEVLQIVARKNEACAKKTSQVMAFMQAYQKSQLDQSVAARAELAGAFEQFKAALEGNAAQDLLT